MHSSPKIYQADLNFLVVNFVTKLESRKQSDPHKNAGAAELVYAVASHATGNRTMRVLIEMRCSSALPHFAGGTPALRPGCSTIAGMKTNVSPITIDRTKLKEL